MALKKVFILRLSLSGPIELYYDVQKPSLNNPVGDESSSGQLEDITIVSGAVFVAVLAALLFIKRSTK